MLVIAGDFVDERTTKAEMIKATQALQDVNTQYGVYYVFGNHDKALYRPDSRDFTGDDLVAELEKTVSSYFKMKASCWMTVSIS